MFGLTRWAYLLSKWDSSKTVLSRGKVREELGTFYDFLSDNRESVFDTGLKYTRRGPYEKAITDGVADAWKKLREAPIVLNANDDFVCAYVKGKPNVYLNASNKYKQMVMSAIVSPSIAEKFVQLLEDGFKIPKFDNLQYIKEKVLKKYIEISDEIKFDNPNDYELEYVEDLKQIIALIEEKTDTAELDVLLKEAFIFKAKDEDGEAFFCSAEQICLDKSPEGIDLRVYYNPGQLDQDSDSYNALALEHIDIEFYQKHNITEKQLGRLGLIISPVSEGRRHNDGWGDDYWTALGEYCPEISVDGIHENISYIMTFDREDELARKKSAEILKLYLAIAYKLQGRKRKRKSNPYESDVEESYFLKYVVNSGPIFFDKSGELKKCIEISKYNLDPEIYAGIDGSKEAYQILGFVESEDDIKADTFERVSTLDKRDKKILLRRLARELGMQVGDQVEQPVEETEDEGVFDPTAWQSEEFPRHKVRNMDSLIQHVREQFYCADPITYEKVLRQIRTSKSARTVRAYAKGMYTNESELCICQMCKKPTGQIDVTELANFGIEMPQLHLCLCRNCSGKYKMLRDANKEQFKKQMILIIADMDVEGYSDEYEISLNSESSISFTQTHLAEIKTILGLLDEYGVPKQQDVEESQMRITREPVKVKPIEVVQETKKPDPIREEQPVIVVHDAIIREGDNIAYRQVKAGISYVSEVDRKTTIVNRKYQLHKLFIGKKAGEQVRLLGKTYEILEKL